MIDKLYAWPTVVRIPAATGGGLMTDTDYEARVITLPVERSARPRPARRPPTAAARQVAAVGSWSVDDWGRDPTLVDAIDPRSGGCAGTRWSAAPSDCPCAPAP